MIKKKDVLSGFRVKRMTEWRFETFEGGYLVPRINYFEPALIFPGQLKCHCIGTCLVKQRAFLKQGCLVLFVLVL